MTADIIQFHKKDVVNPKCSYCHRTTNKIVMSAQDDDGKDLGKFVCIKCVAKMAEMLGENDEDKSTV